MFQGNGTAQHGAESLVIQRACERLAAADKNSFYRSRLTDLAQQIWADLESANDVPEQNSIPIRTKIERENGAGV